MITRSDLLWSENVFSCYCTWGQHHIKGKIMPTKWVYKNICCVSASVLSHVSFRPQSRLLLGAVTSKSNMHGSKGWTLQGGVGLYFISAPSPLAKHMHTLTYCTTHLPMGLTFAWAHLLMVPHQAYVWPTKLEISLCLSIFFYLFWSRMCRWVYFSHWNKDSCMT